MSDSNSLTESLPQASEPAWPDTTPESGDDAEIAALLGVPERDLDAELDRLRQALEQS